jgi:arylsulfatase A-like enzyme
MGKVRNILFIMCDQLRADYLGCTGHPSIRTPNIDALAARGVNFTNTFCQAPVCGPSRMSFYTGRYMTSHGSTYNGVPLNIGEKTLGDYLRPLGVRTGLIGKTHMTPDNDGLKRLGVDPASDDGVLASQCGFEPWERDDGLHPDQVADPNLPYNQYLRRHGYDGDNPWHSVANSAEGPDGDILSGWQMRNNHLPARVAREHSETAYMTDRAMAQIAELGDQPWCMHLSYIKPHWPYMAPAPYHNMYGANTVLPANRDIREKQNPHPVIDAFMGHEESINFSEEECRERVIPAYMGLISEIDDHIGRLVEFLETEGRMDDTLIVFTSDHGDYLGDHWLGEKEMFHEESLRIPMIIVDPDSAADRTRGNRDNRLVEAIDLVPTFVEAAGGGNLPHVLEGRSLLPLLRGGGPEIWRDAVFSEADYAFRGARKSLNLAPDQTRAYMIRTNKWKYISYDGFRSQLFDLENDPNELTDVGPSAEHTSIRQDMENQLTQWLRQRRSRKTISFDQVDARTDNAKDRGYLFGVW